MGVYTLHTPCLPFAVTAAATVLHFCGLALYVWLLSVDVHANVGVADAKAGYRLCLQCNVHVPNAPRTMHCYACDKCGAREDPNSAHHNLLCAPSNTTATSSRRPNAAAAPRCCEGFDHHCDFLQTCVGKQNYRQFVALVAVLTAWTAGLVILDALTLANAIDAGSGSFCASMFDADMPIRACLLVAHALLAVCCCIGVGTLLLLHAYLMMKSSSTYEFFMRQQERTKPPACTFLGLPCC